MAGKKKGRRAYLDDFRKNGQGQYEYGGRLYSYQGKDLGRRKLSIAALCAMTAAAMTAAGCMDAPGMRGCFYVLLPYAAGLAAAAGTCLAAYRLCTGGNPMKAYVYEKGVRKLPGRAAAAAFCAGLAAAGQVVCVLRDGFGGKQQGFAAFLILESAAAGAAWLVWRQNKKMYWL